MPISDRGALVLDSEAVSLLSVRESGRMARVHAALEAAAEDDLDVVVPAAVLSELYRGGGHDQRVDSLFARRAIDIVPTDQALARVIGHLLATAGRGSADHVDASVVATAVLCGGGQILTSDPDDISKLAAGVPSAVKVRVVHT